MKNVALTLILLNIFYQCSASWTVARQTAGQFAKKSSQRSYSSLSGSPKAITPGGIRPATRNKTVKAQEQAGDAAKAQAIENRQADIKAMNKEFNAQPDYSYNSAPASQADKFANAIKARQTIVSKAAELEKGHMLHESAIQQAAHNKASFGTSLSNFDKAYLSGTFATVAAFFGYDALKNMENNQTIENSAPAQTNIPMPLTKESPETKSTDKNPIDKNENSVAASMIPKADNAENNFEDQKNLSGQSPTVANLSMDNLYSYPKDALLTLQNPVVAASIAATAVGGYGYYQYLKYLERVKAEETAKAALDKENEIALSKQATDLA